MNIDFLQLGVGILKKNLKQIFFSFVYFEIYKHILFVCCESDREMGMTPQIEALLSLP